MGGWSLPVPVFLWIIETVPSGSHILELGAGKGTEVLSREYQVTSIENDPRFASSPSVILADITPTPAATSRGQGGWYERETLEANLPKDYDLLIVDAPMRKIGRSGILDHLDLFRSDRTTIIDDVNRPAEKEICEVFAKLLGVEPTILSCDRFPYRQTAILET